MRVLVIGGVPVDGNAPPQRQALTQFAGQLVPGLLAAGHQLVVCSPFEGSIDVEILRAVSVFDVSGQARAVADAVVIHHPHEPSVEEAVASRVQELSLLGVRTFRHPLLQGDDGAVRWSETWLLSQLAALDQADAVVACGGKPDGAATLLLRLAEARRRPVLPFSYLDGAAGEALFRRQYELMDRLGDDFGALQDQSQFDNAAALLDRLVEQEITNRDRSIEPRFFISYPRERYPEADFVEMILRRRHHLVFRDERDFRPGSHLPSEIAESIHRADIFIALWCREYACSPWCFDELELAIARQKAGGLELWMLLVDETRVVPPGARQLLAYPSFSRQQLEHSLLSLLERLQ